jgi:hypothetical protein
MRARQRCWDQRTGGLHSWSIEKEVQRTHRIGDAPFNWVPSIIQRPFSMLEGGHEIIGTIRPYKKCGKFQADSVRWRYLVLRLTIRLRDSTSATNFKNDQSLTGRLHENGSEMNQKLPRRTKTQGIDLRLTCATKTDAGSSCSFHLSPTSLVEELTAKNTNTVPAPVPVENREETQSTRGKTKGL